MTKRELFNGLLAIEDLDQEFKDGLQDLIDKMNQDLLKDKVKRQEQGLEKDVEAVEFAKNLSDELKTATEMKDEFGHLIKRDKELTVQAVSAILRRAVRLGVAEVEDVKVAKRGKQKGYRAKANE